MMNCRSKRALSLLVILLLVVGMLPFSALAAEGITCAVDKEGGNVTISGNTFPGALVSLVVTRTIDGSMSYLDQASTGADGAYSFSFALEGGDYRATVSCNGLHKQADIKIRSSSTKTVTVRVEGKTATKLPRTEVAILAGETTLFDAITSALDSAHVQYEVANGLIHTIDGEEGWQWLIDNRGGMALPSTTLAGGEEIVLVDDLVWDPVITRLTVSTGSVKVGEQFTVTLEGLSGVSASPAPGQPVIFNSETRITDDAGQVTFTPKNQGIFGVTCEPVAANLVRPVPVLVTVSGGGSTPGGGGAGGNSISVKMRIEGYRGTVMNGYVTFNPDDYKGSDGKYRFTDPDGVEHQNDSATVLLATVVAWNQYHIRGNSVGFEDNYVAKMAGEAEKDFGGEHATSGWLVRVNNSLINQGVGVWPVRDGDTIEWYYGDVNSYFGTIDVSPTSLKTGEKIKVKVFGQNNGGMSMSDTGRKEPMEGATVYVGTTEYTTDASGEATITMNNPGTYTVYAVKLDKKSSHGGYYFPLVSKTEEVRVRVSGAAIGITAPEKPADAAKVIKEALESESPTEDLVVEAVKAAADSLANALEKVKTAEEAGQLLNDTAAVTGLLGQAAGKISGSQAAAALADSCLEIAGVLANLAPQLAGDDDRQKLAQSTIQTIEAVTGVMASITDKDKLAAITGSLLDSEAKILQSLEGQQAHDVRQSLVNLVQQALAVIVKETLPADSVKQEGEELQAVVKPGLVAGLAGRTAQAVAVMEQKLARLGIEQNRRLDRDVIIEIPSQGEKTVTATLLPGTLDTVASNGAGRLELISPVAHLSLAPDTFGAAAQDQEITLSASLPDSSQLPAGADLPAGSVVVELAAGVGDQSVTNFNSPIEVALPYPGTPDNPGAVTVFLLKEDGSLEPVGGVYDPATGTVKFLADHFSKYLAKEALRQFADLGSHPWAKEAVEILAGKGIISGKQENLFEPAANITRAEFAALGVRMLRQQVPAGTSLPFKDVSEGSWYHDAVAAAYAGGLVSGTSADRFDPQGNITREEMAAIIAKVLLKKGYVTGQPGDLKTFSDRDSIASWAQAAAALAAREGIISGTGDGRFAPKDRATRAEAAVMLHRLYVLMMR